MTMISLVSSRPIGAAKQGDQSFKAIALFCCCGLAASFGLIALGVNTAAPWL